MSEDSFVARIEKKQFSELDIKFEFEDTWDSAIARRKAVDFGKEMVSQGFSESQVLEFFDQCHIIFRREYKPSIENNP